MPAGFTLEVDAVLPKSVEVFTIPEDAGFPTLTQYRYAVIDSHYVIVDQDLKIAGIIGPCE
jgi:hypothetical protein